MKVSLMISGLMIGLFVNAQSAPSTAPAPASAPTAALTDKPVESNSTTTTLKDKPTGREVTRNLHLEFQTALNLKHKAVNGNNEAFLELQKRCSLGESSSCEFLGRLYLWGPEMMRNTEKGLLMLMENCESGNGSGCESMYVYYIIVKPDPQKAEHYCQHSRQKFIHACENGDGEACFPLGFAFGEKDELEPDGSKKPRCIERNLDEAAKYYQMACDYANDSGCLNLSRMLRNGDGITVDKVKAIQLYDRGLAIIDTDCINNDARQCAARGFFFRDDGHPEEAKVFFRKACELGDQKSCDKL